MTLRPRLLPEPPRLNVPGMAFAPRDERRGDVDLFRNALDLDVQPAGQVGHPRRVPVFA